MSPTIYQPASFQVEFSFTKVKIWAVQNKATKPDVTDDFLEYCKLRDDPEIAFYLFKGCSRKWINENNEERGSSGISTLWPILTNIFFKDYLNKVKDGESPNNISPIIKYNLSDGLSALWMGDLETEFMEKVQSNIKMNPVGILFAPHHGRSSGKVPKGWLDQMQPKIVIIGEASSEHLDYYTGYNTITQNSAGDITFECDSTKIHIYVSSDKYRVSFLENEYQTNNFGYYIGTLNV